MSEIILTVPLVITNQYFKISPQNFKHYNTLQSGDTFTINVFKNYTLQCIVKNILPDTVEFYFNECDSEFCYTFTHINEIRFTQIINKSSIGVYPSDSLKTLVNPKYSRYFSSQ